MPHIMVGDQVVLAAPDEWTGDYYCEHCDEAIGFDEYDMADYDGVLIEIEKIYQADEVGWSFPLCNAQVFNYKGWLWTTCWISAHFPQFGGKPSWEV